MMGVYSQCVADCDRAISLDHRLHKAYIRKAKAQVEMDQFKEVRDVISMTSSFTRHSPCWPCLDWCVLRSRMPLLPLGLQVQRSGARTVDRRVCCGRARACSVVKGSKATASVLTTHPTAA
jgi:hypothetical protein